ncbi:MAG: glycosyltransferase family 4 protein [Verrucomicrobiota bacterium]|nr:glycosyltransferase family 4 protein [Verrucomicrobiota bacterium]
MKVAVVSTGLGYIPRGIETWAEDLAEALEHAGIQTVLFRGGPGRGIVVRHFRREGKAAQSLWRVPLPGRWRVGFGSAYQVEQTTFFPGLLFHITKGKFDIVHLQDPWLGWLLQKTRFFHGCRVILANGTEESMDYLSSFDFVQELSPSYHARHGGKQGRFCIPNFVDTETFCHGDRDQARMALGLPLDGFIVLSVGALRKTRKRMNWLIQEAAACADPRLFLVLAGAVEEETSDIKRLADELLPGRYQLLTNLQRSAMPSVYRAADLFILCSLDEILGIAFLEAMASGIPCMGHQYATTEWVIGKGGTCIDMTMTGSLTDAIRQWSADPLKLHQASQQAIKEARERFSRKVVTDQIIKMYNEVLQG